MSLATFLTGLAQSLQPVSSTWVLLAGGLILLGLWRSIQSRKETQLDAAFSRQHGCLPSGNILPAKWPLGVDILKLQWDALQKHHLLAFQSPYLKRMPNMQVNVMGATGYLTTDPKNIETILHGRFADWEMGSRNAGLFPLLGEGIFTQDGPAWKHSREILRSQFARINFKDLSTFDSHVEHLIQRLRNSASVVDLQTEFMQFTLGTTTSLIFGEAVNDTDIRERSAFGDKFDCAQRISAIRIRLNDLCWIYRPSNFRQACRDVKAYAAFFVDQALQVPNGVYTTNEAGSSKSLIHSLYQELGDKRLVRDQLVHVLVAGRDTTACTLSWAMFLLVRHPRALEQLKAEINFVIPAGETPTRAHVIKMPYLTCVINETMRLYPQLPVNVRVATKRTVLPRGGGPDGSAPLLIPRGTGVAWSVYHMHRREDLYGPDANDFRPERWEGSKLERQVGWGFMPFHGGPRLCLGKEFALTEASYAIVALLRAFPEIRLPPGEIPQAAGEEEQELGLTVSLAQGCNVSLY